MRIDTNEYTVPDCVKRISIEKEEIRQSVLMRNITRTIAVRKICKQVKPIALVSFMEKPCVRALIATTGLQVKNIISVRNDPRREYPGIIGLLLRKYLIPFADGCVFQTEEAKKWFPEKLQKKSKIILNPVDESFFNIKREKVVKNVVTLGRVVKQKNHELLINAFAKIAGYYPDENLLIYGKGNRDIESAIRLMGLSLASRSMASPPKMASRPRPSPFGCFISSVYLLRFRNSRARFR